MLTGFPSVKNSFLKSGYKKDKKNGFLALYNVMWTFIVFFHNLFLYKRLKKHIPRYHGYREKVEEAMHPRQRLAVGYCRLVESNKNNRYSTSYLLTV